MPAPRPLLLLLLPLLWAGSLQQSQGPKIQVQKSVTVQRGLCVLVPCSFSFPSRWSLSQREIYMSWFRLWTTYPYDDEAVATNNPKHAVRPEIKGRFRLLGDIRTKNCSLSIRGATMEDTGSYVFRIETYDYKYGYTDNPVNLKVTDLTEKPVLLVPEPLQSGRPTRLSCFLPGSCPGSPPLTFSWLGDALNSMDPGSLHPSELTLTPRPQDHSSSLTCQVKLGGSQVTTEKTVRLNVSYAPQNFSISVFFRNGTVLQILNSSSSLSTLESQVLQLTCAVDSNPPAQLSWLWDSPALNAPCISAGATLQLPCVGTAETEIFTCQAQNVVGTRNASVSLSMFYGPQLLGPTCSWEAAGLHCSCSSQGRPVPSLRWRLGQGLLEGNSSNASLTVTSSSAGPWANSSLSLHGRLNSSLRLSCESWNVRGDHSATILLLPGKSEPRGGAVVGALGGAGAMALLCLCVCLIFFCITKARRTQAAGRSKKMDDEDPVMGTVTWASKQKPWPESPQTQAHPVGDGLPHQEQQELHYASLNLREMKLLEAKSQEDTVYSEINRNN
ncbi:sialic acid-binding Ig-like lectin 5 [Octodon degus]|uniref:Sialic acid-binding Ig-like lectin 5 n=1 Tax=Octodon degus TaxID=10160 RepID=A0A6P3VEK2_OCTDE|nr:sialic acid-binding Ig-like lectin 5 [Octodon degus]